MKFADIFPRLQKAVTVAGAMIDADNTKAARRALTAAMAVAKPPETVTQADLDATDAELDALLDEFNVPLPPAIAK